MSFYRLVGTDFVVELSREEIDGFVKTEKWDQIRRAIVSIAGNAGQIDDPNAMNIHQWDDDQIIVSLGNDVDSVRETLVKLNSAREILAAKSEMNK